VKGILIGVTAVAHGFLTLERAAPPETGGVGLRWWQLLGELQALLGCWAAPAPPQAVEVGGHHAGAALPAG
jgi:hypothetical protein